MPTYPSNQGAAVGSNAFGNGFNYDATATPTAALTTADAVVLLTLPAGHRLTDLAYRNGDFDTGTTLQFNLGYRSIHPNQAVPAAPTYFLAASAALQAAQASWVDLTFNPITFQEPVQIVLIPTANATGVSGTPSIFVRAKGSIVGVQ